MKRIIYFILVAALLVTSFSLQTAKATTPVTVTTPSKYIITISGWLEPTSEFDTSLRKSGWIQTTDKVIDFPYENFSNTELGAAQNALPRLEAVVNQYCFKGVPCEIHGISRGSDVLIWMENQVGWPKPGLDVYLHNPGAGDTGAARSPFLTDAKWSRIYDPFQWLFGTPNLNAPLPTRGTQLYYNNSDPFANLKPICMNTTSAFSIDLNLPIWHGIVMPKTANFRIWYGPTGDVNHEYGSRYPSGADVKSCPAA